MVTPLPREFYLQNTCLVAQNLLGMLIVRRLPTGEALSGVIVETEAYLTDDPASHGYRGMTPRNRTMFGPPGHAYVYFTYGLHMMLNFVCAPPGTAEAVLVRAIEPATGVDDMRRMRGAFADTRLLTNGPGKLAQALGLTRADDDGVDVTEPGSPLIVTSYPWHPFEMQTATRIGISRGQEHPWRYYVRNNPYISRR